MSKLTRAVAAARRGAAWLVPVLAGWRCRGPGGRPALPHQARIGQGVAAGLLANGLAALSTTVLGTGATRLVVRSPRPSPTPHPARTPGRPGLAYR